MKVTNNLNTRVLIFGMLPECSVDEGESNTNIYF